MRHAQNLYDYCEHLTPNGINAIEQNKPCLIASDLAAFGVPRDSTYSILLACGVFKWLAVRRDLINAKDRWKERITHVIAAIVVAKAAGNKYHHAWLKGYLKGYEECRAEIRAMCHSERWRCPDNDQHARDFLDRIS